MTALLEIRLLIDGRLQRWVEQTHPYWNKTGGKDHIFLASHDEGSCWVPEELR